MPGCRKKHCKKHSDKNKDKPNSEGHSAKCRDGHCIECGRGGNTYKKCLSPTDACSALSLSLNVLLLKYIAVLREATDPEEETAAYNTLILEVSKITMLTGVSACFGSDPPQLTAPPGVPATRVSFEEAVATAAAAISDVLQKGITDISDVLQTFIAAMRLYRG